MKHLVGGDPHRLVAALNIGLDFHPAAGKSFSASAQQVFGIRFGLRYARHNRPQRAMRAGLEQ
jgi:hypothetical protein